MKTFVTRERVAFCETDAAGIIHFASAMRYFELGEREAMRQLGIKVGDSNRGGQEFPRVHITCTYHKSLYYDDLIEIRSTCVNIGNSSMIWDFKIYRDEELCISGEMTVCMIDSETRRPMRVPDRWRDFLLEAADETRILDKELT
ncbi:acyl-CoA thioesterase [Fodinisporobacter ferrooxydans]|uniref:Acyl-CoA thioesterase n=1 Tax=Fodinisporobacter ferrooxydans TaxID=2901836 RepID=A0ABY4CKB8_9BACL|nr:acyl-CoA thioesterase [Alicyclobacillaceae bacterium MYW30-H2]